MCDQAWLRSRLYLHNVWCHISGVFGTLSLSSHIWFVSLVIHLAISLQSLFWIFYQSWVSHSRTISLLYSFEQHSKCCISIDSIPQICTLKWLSCMLRHCQKRCYFTTASDPCNIAGSLVLTSNCHQIWIGQPLQSHGRVICAKATIACPWLLNQWRAVCQNDEINNPNLHSTSWTNTSHLMSFGKTHAAAPGLHLCDPAEPWAAFCRWGSWLLDTAAATAE